MSGAAMTAEPSARGTNANTASPFAAWPQREQKTDFRLAPASLAHKTIRTAIYFDSERSVIGYAKSRDPAED
jgi:hypothetical protein